MKALKIYWKRFVAKTPVFWILVRNLSVGIPTLMTVVNKTTDGTVVPEWYVNNQFYILCFAGILAFWSQSHEEKKGV